MNIERGVAEHLRLADWADHAASALTTLGAGFETTNRKEGRRLSGLTVRMAASNSLKALRFMAATLPLW